MSGSLGSIVKFILRAWAGILFLGAAALAVAQDVPIVQPGAPGEAPKVLSASEATQLADTSYSPADVRFMQGMIVHHQQAVDMAQLVGDRTNNDAVTKIATGILATQKDEITFMREWLTSRDEKVEMPHSMHMGPEGHGMMKGMATPAQMAELAASDPGEELLSALVNLGYPRAQAERVVEGALGEAPTQAGLEDLIRIALRRLAP